jgi:hypothetical protein
MSIHWRRCPVSTEQRFWAKVDRSGNGCWLYCRTDELGYGRFYKAGPMAFAHRTAWLLTHGEIPAGMDVCHTCDVRNCCNPDHLFLGTAKDNMADCKAKRRHTYGEKNRHAKLTEAQVQEIRATYRKDGPHKQSPSNTKELAAKYGVSRLAINSIIAGRTWTNSQGSLSGDGVEHEK